MDPSPEACIRNMSPISISPDGEEGDDVEGLDRLEADVTDGVDSTLSSRLII